VKIEIIPAILSKTAADYHKKFKTIEPFTEWIQVDIVDNKFARNLTIGPKEVAAFRTLKKLEIQLMVDFIEDWVDPFVEIAPKANIKTPASRLQHVIDKADTVLLLSVYPGFSGQHFVHGVLKKIEELRQMRPDVVIEVDGGIEPGTARKCAETGANILAAGSFIFENDTIRAETYQEKVKRALETLKKDVENVLPA